MQCPEANRILPLKLLGAVKDLILPFIRAADQSTPLRASGNQPKDAKGLSQNVLVNSHKPEDLVNLLKFTLPSGQGLGRDGLLQTVKGILRYSVNTWDQGFLDKLYSSNNAVRLC